MNSPIWHTEDFIAAAAEFRDRWRTAISTLGLSSSNLIDLIGVATNSELEIKDGDATLDTPRKRFMCYHRRFAAYSLTAELESPYETLISVIDHGGAISTEHGFIDFHESTGKMVAGFMMRHA